MQPAQASAQARRISSKVSVSSLLAREAVGKDGGGVLLLLLLYILFGR